MQKYQVTVKVLVTVEAINAIAASDMGTSQHLWVLIGKNINDELHGRRLALTQNDADNGFELWRALFKENEGGAEQVALGGMSNLHSFPQCPRIEDLQHWLGQWQMVRQKFGADLPEIHLRQMFLQFQRNFGSEKTSRLYNTTSTRSTLILDASTTPDSPRSKLKG